MGQHGARCSLTIVCTEGEDSGMYACFAHNSSGYASCQAELTVEEGNTELKITKGLLVAAACLLFPALELVAASVSSLQDSWSFRRESWSWEKEGSCSPSTTSTMKLDGESAFSLSHYLYQDFMCNKSSFCVLGERSEWWSASFTEGPEKSLLPSFCLCGAALEPEPSRRGTCCPASRTPEWLVCWTSFAPDALWCWSQKCIPPLMCHSYCSLCVWPPIEAVSSLTAFLAAVLTGFWIIYYWKDRSQRKRYI